MKTLSVTDVSIALAHKNGSLRMVERQSRLGGTFIALEDGFGVIEVCDTRAEAEARIRECAGHHALA